MYRINHKSSPTIAIISILLASLMVFSFGCVKKEEKEIKIGAILPLTGDAAPYGVTLKKGMDLALDKINEKGINGKKLSVIFEDSQADPQKAVNAFNKLVIANKVPMVIGDMFSASTLAIAPIAERQKVVLLSPTASAVELTNAGDYIFRIYPSDTYDGEYIAGFVWNQLKNKTASIIYLQVTSISSVTKIFKEKYEAFGGKIVGIDSYKEGDTDFRSQLLKAKQANAEIIFIPGYLREMAMLLRQAKELGIKKQFLSISTFFDPKVIELAGDAAEGVLFSSPVFDPESKSPEVINFVNSYNSKYNTKPDILAGYGYDVVKIAAVALGDSSTATTLPQDSGGRIKASLYRISNYDGVTGRMSFDKNGDVSKELRMMTISEGKFKTLSFEK